MQQTPRPMRVESPDHDERLKDFFTRHGGPGKGDARAGETPSGDRGWSEVYAGDGHILRCEWSIAGSRTEMKYSEMPAKQ